MRNTISNPIFELAVAGIFIAALCSGSMYLVAGLVEGGYTKAAAAGRMDIASEIKTQLIYAALFNMFVVYGLHKIHSALFIQGAEQNGMPPSKAPAVKTALKKISFASMVVGMLAVLAVLALKLPG